MCDGLAITGYDQCGAGIGLATVITPVERVTIGDPVGGFEFTRHCCEVVARAGKV